MSSPKGFRTKGRGKNRRVYPIYKGYRGFQKGQMTISSVVQAQEMRSPLAKKIDAQRSAPIAKSEEEWINAPNRYDLPDVDTRKGAPQETKEQSRKKKEPWEMTYREFFDKAGSEYTARERFKLDYQGNDVPMRLGDIEEGKTRWVGEIGATPEERIHRSVIRQAILEGKNVPKEVLEQYPDLKPLTNREYLSFKLSSHPYMRYEIEQTPTGYMKIIKEPEKETKRIPLTNAEASELIGKIQHLADHGQSKIYGKLKPPPIKGAIEGSSATYNKATGWMAISFSGIPSPEVRAEMKQNGFRYNPSRKQWVAKAYPFREDLAKKYAGTIEEVNIEPNWAAKADRAESLAVKHEQKSDDLYKTSNKMFDVIPFGQPVLVGHYSEKTDRNYRDRAWNKRMKGVEEHQIAEKYADRADRYRQKAKGESPGLIYRRIQRLEADKRKMLRNKAEAEEKKSQRSLEWANRWLKLYNDKLDVEYKKYKASGGLATDKVKFKPGDRIYTRHGVGTLVTMSKKTARVKLDPDPRSGREIWLNANRKGESLLSVDDIKAKLTPEQLQTYNQAVERIKAESKIT